MTQIQQVKYPFVVSVDDSTTTTQEGSATAVNQRTEIERLEEIRDATVQLGKEAQLDALLLRTVEVRDHLDTLIELLSSGLSNGNFKTVGGNAASRYIVQQTELSQAWIISSPIEYPDVTVYVTQIGAAGELLEPPLPLDAADWVLVNPYQIRVQFDEIPCKGFVILH